jgi:SAM-dependent methyltransferase
LVELVPASACIYERYDPETLAPLEPSAAKRLISLGWTSEEFAAKSVLDVGCNSGLLSVTAARLGADRVHSVDVNKELVAFLAAVADRHRLPIVAEVRSFSEIDPEQPAADIVIFMEALQWIVAQGSTVESVLNKISLLTKSVLYIEFPWDGSDVLSDRNLTITEEFNSEYSSDKIFAGLSRFFRHVEVLRFMRYFGYNHPKSNRVLVRCSGKRKEAPLLIKMGRADSLDVTLGTDGRNSNSVLVDTPSGLKVLKCYFEDAPIRSLSDDLREAVFRQMATAGVAAAIWPEAVCGKYVTAADQNIFSVMPFVGDISGLIATRTGRTTVPAVQKRLRVGDLLNVSFAWSQAAIGLDASLLGDLQRAHFFRGVDARAWELLTEPTLASGLAQRHLIDFLVRSANSSNIGRIRFLQHGDIHYDNVIRNAEGNIRLVDFDLMCLGTCCTDLVRIMVFANSGVPLVRSSLNTLEVILSEKVSKFDIAYALNMFLIWYRGALRLAPSAFGPLTEFTIGLSAILAAYDAAPEG